MLFPPATALAALVLGIGVVTAQQARAQKDFSTPPQMDRPPSGSAAADRNTPFHAGQQQRPEHR